MAKEMKKYTLAEMKNKYIGKVGSKKRDEYEYELRVEVLEKMIKVASTRSTNSAARLLCTR
jgi:HTH-type transcriptional regulator/antitoxin HipB